MSSSSQMWPVSGDTWLRDDGKVGGGGVRVIVEYA